MGLGNFLLPSRAALLNSSVAMQPGAIPVAEPDKKKIAERAAQEAYARMFRQATAMLMTGPRATPPRPSTVRRMLRLVHRDKGPSIKGALIRIDDKRLLHPTKGFRSA